MKFALSNFASLPLRGGQTLTIRAERFPHGVLPDASAKYLEALSSAGPLLQRAMSGNRHGICPVGRVLAHAPSGRLRSQPMQRASRCRQSFVGLPTGGKSEFTLVNDLWRKTIIQIDE